MIRCGLVPELSLPTRIRQQDPTGATGERPRGADEFAAPCSDTSKVLLEHGPHRVWNLIALAAEVSEIKLVERDRAHRDELLALQRTQPIGRRPRIECGKLRANRIQRPHGLTVVVLVVAHDHSLRDSVQRPWAYRDRCDLLLHGRLPPSLVLMV